MSGAPRRTVLKVLWQENLSRSVDDVEVVHLVEDVVNEVKRKLEWSNRWMVESTMMGKWKVGYLGRCPQEWTIHN